MCNVYRIYVKLCVLYVKISIPACYNVNSIQFYEINASNLWVVVAIFPGTSIASISQTKPCDISKTIVQFRHKQSRSRSNLTLHVLHSPTQLSDVIMIHHGCHAWTHQTHRCLLQVIPPSSTIFSLVLTKVSAQYLYIQFQLFIWFLEYLF